MFLRNQFFNTIMKACCATIWVIFPISNSALVHAQETSCSNHAGWADSDGDRIPDVIETAQDADADGIPNYLDEDSDNDGIPDSSEAFNIESLSDHDHNGDGIDDTYDVDPTLLQFPWHDPEADGVANDRLPIDSDNDGIADYLDTDSDNDGIADALEINSTSSYRDADTDSDGLSDSEELALGTLPNKWDSDNGGVSDGMERKMGSDPLRASDDHLHVGNLDADNDGIPNDIEGHLDTDQDRIPDCLDIDSDNDNWFDIREAGLPDNNHDGIVDDSTDANADGMADAVAGLITTLPDTDSDLIPNVRDVDADNDGIADYDELPDVIFTQNSNIDRYDIDGDGYDNNADTDADGDLLFDILEAGYYENDANGIADLMTDSDLDGIVDAADIDSSLNAGTDAIDSDSDGIVDHFDTQHSVETTTTIDWTTLEEETVTLPNPDLDGDSIVDRHDPDHDGDGFADQFNYQVVSTTDVDADGLIALFDVNDASALDASAMLPLPADTSIEATPITLRPVAAYISCETETETETATGTATDPDSNSNTTTTTDQQSESSETPTIAAAAPQIQPPDSQNTQAQASQASGGGGGSAGIGLLMLLMLGRLMRREAFK